MRKANSGSATSMRLAPSMAGPPGGSSISARIRPASGPSTAICCCPALLVAAISVGLVKGEPMLDLADTEASAADTDRNIVTTGSGKFLEVQGTAEHAPFDRDELNTLLDLGLAGNASLAAIQREVLGQTS